MASQRQARRERNKEDFLRATRQALAANGHRKEVGVAGVNAGNTYREHLEDEIRKAVRVYLRLTKQALDPSTEGPDPWSGAGIEHKRKAARGYMRGLCKALLTYEDSYNKDDKNKLIRMEKEFLQEAEA